MIDRTPTTVSDDAYLAAVESLIPLGRSYAYRWGGDADDMFSDAMIGAMQAVKRYDPSRGIPLHYFAGPRMTGEIVDQVRRLSWRPRDSRNPAVSHTPRQVQVSLEELLRGRTVQAVAGELGVTHSRVCQINRAAGAAMRKSFLSQQEVVPGHIDFSEAALSETVMRRPEHDSTGHA